MTIENLESKIKIMNGDAFHRLCDHFLYYDGGDDFDSINPIGQTEGKQKSRGGTPDTKIKLDNGLNILIQYTTQDSAIKSTFYKKLLDDLQACFDVKKTKVKISEIKEVVLCFNSNINTATEQLLNEEAAKHKVPLKLINLSTIAHKIYKFYHYLAKDYLGIEIGTYQLLSVKKFIEEYEKGGIATPLSNRIQKRETELTQIKESIERNLVTVIAGKAGVGKSRLAVEAVKNFSKGNKNFIGFCIKNKDLPIIFDLRRNLNPGKQYLIYIDDANKSISHLRDVITFYQESNLDFKLILTVRDYVLHELQPFIKGYSSSVIKIDNLDHAQIREIINAPPFNIRNQLFQNRIIEVAKGNPRMAVMAALASKGRKLDDLANVSDIYDLYFQRVSGDNQLLFQPSYMKVLGLLAFFRTIDKDNIDITKTFKALGVKKNSFWTKVYDLERYEIVDIFSDRSTVKFTDQILEGYIFYRVFFIDKLLDYQIVFERFFDSHRHRITYTAVDANNTFGYKDFGNKILPFIKGKYKSMVESGQDPFELLKIFWIYLQDETLSYAKFRIDEMPVEPDWKLTGKVINGKHSTKTFEFENRQKPSENPRDEFFDLIAEYLRYELDDFDLANELLFGYLEKNQHLADELVKFCKSHFNFTHQDELYSYYRPVQFTNALINKVHQGRPIYTYIFLKLMPHFLQTTFDSSFFSGRSFTISKTAPLADKEILEIREKYWNCFIEHYTDYPALSYHTLKAIADTFFPHFHMEMRMADWPQLSKLFDRHFDVTHFKDAYVINQFADRMLRGNVGEAIVSEQKTKAQTTEYSWFLALDWNLLRRKERWNQENEDHNVFEKRFDELKKREILAAFILDTVEDYLIVFDFIGRCMSEQLWDHFSVGRPSHLLLEKAQKDDNLYLTLLTKLICKDYFFRMFTVQRVFNMVQNDSPHLLTKVEDLLSLLQYPQKQKIRIYFYDMLYEQNITISRADAFLQLLDKLSGEIDLSLHNSVHYIKVDPDFLYKALSLLLKKAQAKEIQFSLGYDFIENNFTKMKSSISLAEDLYLCLQDAKEGYDYEGSELLFLVNRNPDFFDRYLDYLIANKKYEHSLHHQIGIVWKCVHHLAVISSAVDKLINAERYHYSAENLANHLFDNMTGIENFDEKKFTFFKSYIELNFSSNKKIKTLFKLIIGRAGSYFGELVKLYLSLNPDLKLFTEINWLHRSTVLMSGNTISGEIDEAKLTKLKNIVSEMRPKLDFMEHKAFLNLQIERCRKSAVSERKWNFLRGDD